MRSRRAPGLGILAVTLVLLLVSSVLSAGATPAAQSGAQAAGAPILLKAAVFRPGLGEQPNIPPGLTIAGYQAGQRGYYLVQFNGPIEEEWKNQLSATGAEIVAYVPEFAFKVRMNPGQARRVEQLGAVQWVGLFHPAYKLSPDLVRDGTHVYTVRVERGADAGLAAAAIARSGATVLAREEQMLLVAADSAQIDAIAHVLDVAWVQNFLLNEPHNEYGAGAIMGANTANANGYDGSSQTVAVADTGIGDGTASGAHPDIPSARVVAVNNWPGASNSCYNVFDDGAVDVDSGHGTHVAGSVLSDGGASGEGKGAAPTAKLVFQAVENYADMKGICALSYPDGYYLIGIPSDLRQLFQQAYDQGARVHANSWGSDVSGDYTADSAYADDFVWNRRDMTITFSAGNAGKDADSNGTVDNDSIGSPATAKNVITVGASENDRNGNYPCDTSLSYASHDSYQNGQTCSQMGGNNLLGTGTRWGFNHPTLASDPTAGNQEQMALFSSRGPTDDGRIKPDIVAPGTWILSGYSDLYQEQYEGDPVNPRNGLYQWDGWGMPMSADYKWMGGTSMSNPLAAGAAAVVRDYYHEAHGVNASAALVKATLINAAVDMQDENNDGANDNDYPIPNVHEGWGRVDVANATDGSQQFRDEGTALGTNATATYTVTATQGAIVRITLVWSDYPSTEAASKNLVNDLDLKVTAPNGTVYYGNAFSGGWSASGNSADRANNVENVYIQSAASGTWTIEVRGYNVPNGPQPFALVVDGADAGSLQATTPNSPPTAAFSYSCTNLTCSFDGSASSDSDGSIVSYAWNFGDNTTASGATVSHTYAAAGTYNVTLTVTDNGGATDGETKSVTVSSGTTPTMHVGDLDRSTSKRGNKWTATVTITIHDASENRVSGAAVSVEWSNGATGTASCTTNTSGQCTVSKTMSTSVTSVTLTVRNVTHSSFSYDATQNHDPDGDSNGTTITVNRP